MLRAGLVLVAVSALAGWAVVLYWAGSTLWHDLNAVPSCCSSELVLVRPDGTGRRVVLAGKAGRRVVDVSPDLRRTLLAEHGRLYVAELDGTHAHRQEHAGSDLVEAAHFDRHGSRVVYPGSLPDACSAFERVTLWSAKADGSGVQRLRDVSCEDALAAVPGDDGSTVRRSRGPGGVSASTDGRDLWITTGRRKRRIAHAESSSVYEYVRIGRLRWTPAGELLYARETERSD